MLNKSIANTTAGLMAQGVPRKRAEPKAESTAVGYLAVIPGLMLCLGTGAIVTLVLLLGVEVSWKVVALITPVALFGLSLTALGFSLISREAAPWIGAVGEWAVKMVRGWRRKNGA